MIIRYDTADSHFSSCAIIIEVAEKMHLKMAKVGMEIKQFNLYLHRVMCRIQASPVHDHGMKY